MKLSKYFPRFKRSYSIKLQLLFSVVRFRVFKRPFKLSYEVVGKEGRSLSSYRLSMERYMEATTNVSFNIQQNNCRLVIHHTMCVICTLRVEEMCVETKNMGKQVGCAKRKMFNPCSCWWWMTVTVDQKLKRKTNRMDNELDANWNTNIEQIVIQVKAKWINFDKKI